MSSKNGGTTEKVESLPRIKIRIEQLSDLVFGLALSIGSLELLARAPQTVGDLQVSIGLFAFSFFIIVSTWIGYTRIMTIISQETSGALGLNLLLLFVVVLEPYLFFVLQTNPSDSFLDWASFAYALDVGSMFLILGGLIRLAVRKTYNGKVSPEIHPVLLRRFQASMIFYTVIGAAYIVSALPFFWVKISDVYLRFDLWYSSFAFVFLGFVNRRRERNRTPNRHD